ncbi:MAG: sigma-70 family RNA polymerase sigma factor [Chloroflexota bacterium]|nr:sigma-70 family RNA polymerase sigma factor [Chloroflexota bacterium]
MTVNHCLNRRRKRHPFLLPLYKICALASHLPSPERRMRMNEEVETVRQAVSRLTDKQQAVVILRYYWELSYAEIANILDIPLGTVKSRLYLAHKTLRKELEGNEILAKTHLVNRRFSDELSRSERTADSLS